MKPETISDALNNIDDTLLAEAISIRQTQTKRSVPKIIKIFAAAACLAIVVSLTKETGIWKSFFSNPTDSSGEDSCDLLPGEIQVPVLQVNGKLYYCAGVNLTQNQMYLKEDGSYGQDSYLPDSCKKIGEISSVTKNTPTEDFQLQAGFEASGAIYADENMSEAVYVMMTTDRFEDTYIRFESDWLWNLDPMEHEAYINRVAILTINDIEHISRIDFYMDFEEPRYTISDPDIINKIGMELANMHVEPPKEKIVSYTYENVLDVRLVMDNGNEKRLICDAEKIYVHDSTIEKDIYSILIENGKKQ